MAQLLSCAAVAGHRDEVRRVGLAQEVERFLDLAQLDGAVGVQVAALRRGIAEALAGEQRLAAAEVAGLEMGVGQPECVVVVVCLLCQVTLCGCLCLYATHR
jgi:hypothetical protein